MKQLVSFLLFSIAIPVYGFAGNMHTDNVPASVKTAFSAKYPEASVRKWIDKKSMYIAKFNMQHKEYTAYFEPNGSWEMTERKFGLTHQLPAAVREGFHNSMYAAYNIDGIKEIMTNGKTSYTIKVDNGDYLDSDRHDSLTQGFMLTFSADGQLISTKQQQS